MVHNAVHQGRFHTKSFTETKQEIPTNRLSFRFTEQSNQALSGMSKTRFERLQCMTETKNQKRKRRHELIKEKWKKRQPSNQKNALIQKANAD